MFQGLGSGENGELQFIDVLSILSFVISVQNLGLNLSQEDIAKQTKEIDAKVDEQVDRALKEIHNHLKNQDIKINLILERMGIHYENDR